MRFGIGLPQLVHGGRFDPERFSAYVRRAEALGFESAWVQEQVLGPAPLLSPLEALSYAAACSVRLRLGCAVLVTPLHSPVHLAREVASVDQLSRGRLELGVVAGGPGRPYAAFGLTPEGALGRFDEGLALMKALWHEPEVSAKSRFFELEGATMGLKPVQRPHPPLWLGGNHPDALRRAVRLGQGFIGTGSQATSRFAGQAALVRGLRDAGEGAEGFRIAKRVYVAIDSSAEAARDRLAPALRALYPRLPPEKAFAFVVAGTPDECAAGVKEVAEAGAELAVLSPLYDEDEQMERLASEVVPQLADD